MSNPLEDSNDDDSLQEALKRIAESEAVHPQAHEASTHHDSHASLGGTGHNLENSHATLTGGDRDDDSLEFCLKEIAAAEARGSITGAHAPIPIEVPMAPGDYMTQQQLEQAQLEAFNEPPLEMAKPAPEPEMALPALKPAPPSLNEEVPLFDSAPYDPMADYRKREAEKLKAEKAQYKTGGTPYGDYSEEREDSGFLTRPERNIQLGKGTSMNTGTRTPGAVSVGEQRLPANAPNAEVSTLQLAVEEQSAAALEQKKKKQQSMMESLMVPAAMGVTVVVVIIVIVIIVMTVTGGKGDDEVPMVESSSSGGGGAEQTKEPLLPFAAANFDASTVTEIEKGGTPQTEAYNWIAQDPALDTYSTGRLRQRFAMATFFFSTSGEQTWRERTNWISTDPTVHECEWFSTSTTKNPCGFTDEQLAALDPAQHYEMLHLALVDNDLQGTIPPEIVYLSGLQTINLFGNSLSGTIPPEFSRLYNLESLDLSGNALTGGIPASLAQLEQLTELYLESNQLTGHIPPALGSSNLQYLRLKGNTLRGIIPDEVCAIRSFTIDCTATIYGCNC